MKIALNDIRCNPNRDLKFNPFNEEKIAALMASIGETGFWTNVIVRVAPDGKGYEQAYGHHRLESARRSGIKEADFVVRDLDENMMLKMMELENQEDYRYCPLSLLESVKAVVSALAAGRIAPFYRVEDGTLPPEGHPERYKGTYRDKNKWKAQMSLGKNESKTLGYFESRDEAAQAYRVAVKGTITAFTDEFRYSPSFAPCKAVGLSELQAGQAPYTAADIAKFLGRAMKNGQSDSNTRAALDALYLLEVKAITTATIKDMNWAQLSKFVADMKAQRERTILRTKRTKEEIAKINEQSLRIQAEQKAKEKKVAEDRAALVKKLAEAKREEDKNKARELKELLEEKAAEAEQVQETFTAKKAALETKLEEVKHKQAEAKQEDVYLPIRKEADRLVHIFERRDEEDVVKALARKDIQPAERERLRQAAISKGTWYLDWVSQQFLPPLSVKSKIEDYRRREEAKRRAEQAKETK